MRNYKHTWVYNGLKTDGDLSTIGENVVALVNESNTESYILDPAYLSGMLGDGSSLALYRGTSSVADKAKLRHISEIKYKGIVHPQKPKASTVIIGYDGVDKRKTLDFSGNKSQTIVIDLMGDSLTLLGAPNNHIQATFSFNPQDNVDSECQDACGTVDCSQIVRDGVIELLSTKLINGYVLGDVLTASPISSCQGAEPTTTDAKFYTLVKCDNGSQADLAEVQNTINFAQVERVSRDGAFSTYKLLNVDASDVPDFETKTGSILKGCADCPTGYDEVKAGYLYTVQLEDEGADLASTAESLPTAIAGSGLKIQTNGGTGTYLVTLEKEATVADIKAFIDANPHGKVSQSGYNEASSCVSTETTTYTWEEGDTCKMTTESYSIILPDTECGESRLAELQRAYPKLVIAESTVYLPNRCRRGYTTTVNTNIVCEDCNPEAFTSVAPEGYLGEVWFKDTATTTSGDCLCGVQFRGKLLEDFPPACLGNNVFGIRGDIDIAVSKAYDSQPTSLSSSESKAAIPVTRINGSIGSQYGADFEEEIARQNSIEQYGISATTRATQYVLNQEFPLESGKQYPVALFDIECENIDMAHSGKDKLYLELALILADTSADSIEALKKINWSKNNK